MLWPLMHVTGTAQLMTEMKQRDRGAVRGCNKEKPPPRMCPPRSASSTETLPPQLFTPKDHHQLDTKPLAHEPFQKISYINRAPTLMTMNTEIQNQG